jgi:hypothetical protein
MDQRKKYDRLGMSKLYQAREQMETLRAENAKLKIQIEGIIWALTLTVDKISRDGAAEKKWRDIRQWLYKFEKRR